MFIGQNHLLLELQLFQGLFLSSQLNLVVLVIVLQLFHFRLQLFVDLIELLEIILKMALFLLQLFDFVIFLLEFLFQLLVL